MFQHELSAMSIDFPKEEEAIIARWREIKAFERQVRIPLIRPTDTIDVPMLIL